MPRPDRGPLRLARDPAEVEAALRRAVGDQVHLACETTETSGGRSHREQEFRLGRAALARVLGHLRDPSDPLSVRFPHPSLSLAHSGNTAVAVGLRRGGATGVGVDVELPRDVDRRAARFFLGPGEERLAADTGLQQLWTVKEAVFKADLDNAGHLLRDYRILHLDRCEARILGTARRGALRFRFTSVRLPDLILTLATRERPAP